MLKVLAMALEPSLWETLPKELLHLVFARLPGAKIGQLRVLSKEWKKNIDCKDSEFNRVFYATTHLKMFALVEWVRDETFANLYDVQTNDWLIFEINTENILVTKTTIADGGLFCSPCLWSLKKWSLNAEGHFPIIVMNPLTQRKIQLPPLLSMGAAESDVLVIMVQLTMDRKTKEYKLNVVGGMKTGGYSLFAQVYDSHSNEWSVVESREGRIIGWGHPGSPLYFNCPYVYNFADRSLQRFNHSDIAPGLREEPNCTAHINDHFFVLHKEAPPGSTNLMQDGESISEKYCISEFHLPEKATAWVKLRVYECDPSIYDSREHYTLSLLACNGFLLVRSQQRWQYYDRLWLYNLSTCAWRTLPNLELSQYDSPMLCKISWSALP